MNLLLSIFMVLSSMVTFVPGEEAKIIASSCYLYSESSFSSEYVVYEDSPVTLSLGDEVEIISDDEGDFLFVSLPSTEIEGYVYRYYVSASNAQVVYPTFNATLRKDSALYDNNLLQTDITLKSGERLFLYDGYDDKREYTPVQVVLEDGSLYNGLVLTTDIKPDGISSLLIVGITIIAASATIILSLIFIKKSRDKKKKKKININ